MLPQNHPLADAPYVTLEELAKENFLVIEEGSLSKPLEAFKQAGLEPAVRLRVHDDYSILSMVETGLGVSILPELVLKKTGYQVAVRQLRPAVTRKMGLITRDKNTLPLASKFLLISCLPTLMSFCSERCLESQALTLPGHANGELHDILHAGLSAMHAGISTARA